jgi:hypothetical protein
LGYFFQNKLVAVSVAHYFETLHLESDVHSWLCYEWDLCILKYCQWGCVLAIFITRHNWPFKNLLIGNWFVLDFLLCLV